MTSKISVITAVYNREKTIGRAIRSVREQAYEHVEHILVDGQSTDATLAAIANESGNNLVIISEPDTGIYDALNKGINKSSGDIIGMLHSDDIFASSDSLGRVASHFENPEIDFVYADATFFNPQDPQKVVRRYSSANFTSDQLKNGNMPAHTTLFIRKYVFANLGMYRSDYEISADFEFMIRLFGDTSLKSKYVPEVWVMMQTGGASTAGLNAKLKVNKEVMRACREHGIATSPTRMLARYPKKILGYLKR